MKPDVRGGSRCLAALGLALWTICFAALADQTVRLVDPQSVPWLTWAWVGGLSLAGWFASSAPKLASWADEESRLEKRLGVAQSVVVSLIAGFIAYLLALVTATPNLVAFVGVVLAAYGGDKYLSRMAAQRIGADAKQQ